MKKEDPNDPKTREFELNIYKHINKRAWIAIFILLLRRLNMYGENIA